jgi:BspA type Leucine rich repeat region (6 copies)
VTSVTFPNSVTSIGYNAFYICPLTNVTMGNGLTSIGSYAFFLTGLKSVTIPSGVTNIGYYAFGYCAHLTGITLPNSVTTIGYDAFDNCTNLGSVTIGNSVTSIGYHAFADCTSLTSVYCKGNAPSADATVFSGDNNATVYYLPRTTGWGPTFGGRPTALWDPPTLLTSPQTQTAEAGSAVDLSAHATNSLPLFYLWYLDATNLLSCGTNCELQFTNVQFAQSGAYIVVVSNVFGAVTSAPAMLNVTPAVERRMVPGVKVTGDVGSELNVDYANSLSSAPDWATRGSVSLTSTSQFYFDLTAPLPSQRFYRAWQTGTPSVVPSLNLNFVPAVTLTGSAGDALRLDYINAIGPTDAWVTLDTVTLTNTSQLYFDVSAPAQPTRLYRIVPVP